MAGCLDTRKNCFYQIGMNLSLIENQKFTCPAEPSSFLKPRLSVMSSVLRSLSDKLIRVTSCHMSR